MFMCSLINTSVYKVLFMCVSQANIALFEARCKEKIQQFEDAGSDEEDIWDEKDVTFAPETQRRPRYNTIEVRSVQLPAQSSTFDQNWV